MKSYIIWSSKLQNIIQFFIRTPRKHLTTWGPPLCCWSPCPPCGCQSSPSGWSSPPCHPPPPPHRWPASTASSPWPPPLPSKSPPRPINKTDCSCVTINYKIQLNSIERNIKEDYINTSWSHKGDLK